MKDKTFEELELAFDDAKKIYSKLLNNKKLIKGNTRLIGLISSLIHNMNTYYTENNGEMSQCEIDLLFSMVSELEIMKYKLIKKV